VHAASSLLILARDVRARTLRLLDAAGPDELTWTPPGTANGLLWHAGHAAWLQDVLGLRLIEGPGLLPPGWDETFGMGSRPGSAGWSGPGRDEVRRVLEAQLPRWLAAVAAQTAEQLDARPAHAGPRDSRTLRESLVHGLHDEACHQGEMYLLLKMRRLAPPPPDAGPGAASHGGPTAFA
jgi:hypothetical protein